MIASANRFALLHEMPPDLKEPEVDDLLARMAQVDIVLPDGFRRSSYPKLEVVPAKQDKALLGSFPAVQLERSYKLRAD